MSKLRSDSTWNKLTTEQRETLEGWLFEEGIGYREVLERAEKEFQIKASLSSLADFYQRRARERAPGELAGLETMLQQIENSPVDISDLTEAAMTLVAKRMVHLAVESPENVREMASLGRLLISNEAQNTRRSWLRMGQDRVYNEHRKEKADEAHWEAINNGVISRGASSA